MTQIRKRQQTTKNTSVAVAASVATSTTTSSMLNRLRKSAVPEYPDVKSIAKVLKVEETVLGRLPEFAKSWPYFRADNIAQFFDLSKDVDACLFNQTELLILNDSGVKHMFFSVDGVYKLLLLSDFSDQTKINLIKEFRGEIFETEWFTTKVVPNKSKYPTVIAHTMLNETPIDKYMNTHGNISTVTVSKILFGSGNYIKFYGLPYGTIKEIQLTTGCTRATYASDIIFFGQDSPNLTSKKEGKTIMLTKKFKPIFKHKIYSCAEMFALLCVLMPKHFVRIIINGSDGIHDLERMKHNMTHGFLYCSPENVLTVGDNIDNSVSFSVDRACRIADTIFAKKLIDLKWSFDEIVAHLALVH